MHICPLIYVHRHGMALLVVFLQEYLLVLLIAGNSPEIHQPFLEPFRLGFLQELLPDIGPELFLGIHLEIILPWIFPKNSSGILWEISSEISIRIHPIFFQVIILGFSVGIHLLMPLGISTNIAATSEITRRIQERL